MGRLELDSRQLLAELQKLEKKVAKTIAQDALKKGAEPIYQEMLKNVPVAKINGGLLRSSIEIGKITGSVENGMKIKIGISPMMYEQVKYGFYQEYGTGVMMGKFWMARSWQNGIGKAKKIIDSEVKKSLGL